MPPKRQRCIPKLSAPKVMRQGMHVLYKIKFVDRRESVVANVSIGELLCEAPASRERFQRLGNNYSKSQHAFISSGSEDTESLQHGSVSHVLDLLAPVRLGCLCVQVVTASNGCGSIVRTSARAREKMERAGVGSPCA